MKSVHDVDATVERLRALIEQKGLTFFASVDHAANAANVGLELPPTVVVIFGNPNLGTPLMQAERTVAIDLPQKMLVWEAEDGQTWIAYNNPWYLKWRHGVADLSDTFRTIATALSQLAEDAARP